MSDMIFPLLEQITKRLDELKGGLNHLRHLIQNDDALTIHELAIIPYRTTEQDSLPEILVPEPVPRSEQNAATVADLITAIHYKDDQHPKSTLRVAGLVGASAEVIQGVENVNKLKAEFKNAVKEVPYRQRRMLRKHFPGLSYLQAYRELVALNGHPDGAHFFWAANKTGIARKTVADLRKELETEKESVPVTDSQLLQAIQFDIEQLAHLPDTEILAKRRSIRLHPQCNVWEDGRIAAQEDAYLPIFYLRKPHADDPDVRSLPSSSEQGQRQRGIRSDRKVEEEPFLERIHVYRYLPAHRKFGK